jgi:hypothetical protein
VDQEIIQGNKKTEKTFSISYNEYKEFEGKKNILA